MTFRKLAVIFTESQKNANMDVQTIGYRIQVWIQVWCVTYSEDTYRHSYTIRAINGSRRIKKHVLLISLHSLLRLTAMSR